MQNHRARGKEQRTRLAGLAEKNEGTLDGRAERTREIPLIDEQEQMKGRIRENK